MLFDVDADAARAFQALRGGGIVIVPHSVGYAALGGSNDALLRIFHTKRRGEHKRNAMIANSAIQREVHALSSRGREVVEAITADYDLPLGCIGPANVDHPLLSKLGPEMLERSSRDGTVVMLLNAGRFHAALTAMSYAQAMPLFGSSANLSTMGTNFSVEHIEPEIIAIADEVIDHGLQKYHPSGTSSTLLNVETLEVWRVGSCYEDIAYILKRHFGHALPSRQEATAALIRTGRRHEDDR